jgi:hypothetical protein
MLEKIRPLLLTMAIFMILFSCMQNPTPEELGMNFTVATDKDLYNAGDEIKITFSNMGATEIRVTEALIREGKSVSYYKSFLFFMEILQSDGSWKTEIPYEYNFGSEFPLHMRPGEKRNWTSARISKEYQGKKVKFGLLYKDETNQHSFTAYSHIIEILE